MKVLVFGSRKWVDQASIERELAKLPPGTIVIHGAAPGADTIAGYVAKRLGFKVLAYPANWTSDGLAAGPIRNAYMLEQHPDIELGLGFMRGRTKGSLDMWGKLQAAGIPVQIFSRTG